MAWLASTQIAAVAWLGNGRELSAPEPEQPERDSEANDDESFENGDVTPLAFRR